MRDRYRLQGLNDDELVSLLPKLAQREKEVTADLLAHLAELEARQSYAAMGFNSMWDYCLVALGMCRTTAWRKLTAARICYRFPGNLARVASGELQVAAIAELHRYLTDENGVELLAACVGKCFSEVELLLAQRFPKPDLSDSIRRVPDRRVTDRVEVEPRSEEPPSRNGSAEPGSEVPVSSGPAPTRTPSASQRGRVEPLSPDRFAVRFTADAEFLALLEEVRGLGSHRGTGDLLDVLKAGLIARKRELLKRRFAVGRNPRNAPPKKDRSAKQRSAAEKSLRRRHVPADVAREVFQRDEGRCSYVSPDGRRCSARRHLQFDHVVPHAKHGAETTGNLRLLCETHNQLAARLYFGVRYMRAVMKRVRARRRGPDTARTGAPSVEPSRRPSEPDGE